MGFLIHSGAEHDPIGLEGLSHFVEHLVSKNTSISSKDISAFLEDCGGIVNFGSTGYPQTYYRFFVPTDKIILTVIEEKEYLAKIKLGEKGFDLTEIDLKRKVSLKELKKFFRDKAKELGAIAVEQ